MQRSNEGRSDDARVLRHVRGCEFEVFGLIGRFVDRWSSRMDGKGLQHCYQTSFKT